MNVWIKEFQVEMQIKNRGIELAVYNNDEPPAQIGDLIITKTGLIWCLGRTTRENGRKKSWAQFGDWMRDS